MQGIAGVVVFRGSSVLLVNEPDYFTGEPRWTFPSGHIEDGEDPATAAARELAEESGCVVDPAQLEIIAISDVEQDGVTMNRSWNYTGTTTDAALRPRTQDGETVTEARWFDPAEAVELLGRSTYPPKTKPVARFLTSGECNLHWTCDLIGFSSLTPTFRWEPPTPTLPE
ncbi:NUDIX domain-containing protein [Actinopolymorpha rutila]|uniref:ADP-ribose pyrophosphatase YjhB (NUDIX family) n=1 Tax=Actinopolymorpha rutila TaxID=446787 RepID=A0A852ZU41_9ACTN|nr:NUDIX domain-containing protein [Actinopolymorpha rutila]NYH92849.1 ADP-ribose pyrophosphatase YjhB (NUDIX family) [Actinopolymorpha rutila]